MYISEWGSDSAIPAELVEQRLSDSVLSLLERAYNFCAEIGELRLSDSVLKSWESGSNC